MDNLLTRNSLPPPVELGQPVSGNWIKQFTDTTTPQGNDT